MKHRIIILIIFISIFSYAESNKSFDSTSFNKGIDFLSKSWEFQINDKTVKAEREKKEAIKIMNSLFKKDKIIEAEFIKSDSDSDTFMLNRPEFKTVDSQNPAVGLIFKIYHNSWDESSIKTSNVILEKYQDSENFKAKIKMINYMNFKDEKPYHIFMQTNGYEIYIEVNCKIISVDPVVIE